MKAKLPLIDVSNARRPENKEMTDSWDAVVCYKGEIRTPVTVRCYMGRSKNSSVVYACIWAHGLKNYVSGSGHAGGGGYCKRSAAIAAAIADAGIKLYGSPYSREDTKANQKKECHIGSTGTTAVETAMAAISKALGYRGKVTIVRN